jgi:4'-phosphopantetheinyl transferase
VIRIGEAEVHVWRAALDAGPAALRAVGATLSGPEQARAQEHAFDCDRTRFVLARGILRRLLGRYLSLPPEAVPIESGAFGKPRLAAGFPDLRFNVSHSAGVAVIAVAQGREVGIDVERLDPARAWSPIADRFFSPAELAGLRELPPDRYVRGFFDCWTRKEAYAKAIGRGLGPCFAALDGWSLRGVPVGPGFAAALAVFGAEVDVRLMGAP